MTTNAKFISDEKHLALNADGRVTAAVNTASLPGIVGDAWAMADWHYGCFQSEVLLHECRRGPMA